MERMHNQVLLEMLDQLTENAAVAPADFDVVAFGAGPGSFTGVRIAAAVAQSVALVANAAVVPVASSRAMIQASDLSSGKVVAVTRSRGAAYYLAGYERRDDGWRLILPDALHSAWPPELREGDWVCVGDRPEWTDTAQIPSWVGAARVRAIHVGELALAAFHRGEGQDPAQGLPLYVSGDTPWQPA